MDKGNEMLKDESLQRKKVPEFSEYNGKKKHNNDSDIYFASPEGKHYDYWYLLKEALF